VGLEAPTILRPFVTQCSQSFTPCSGHLAPHLTGDRQTDRHPLFWPPCTTPYWGQADRQTDTPCSGHLAAHLTGDRQTDRQTLPVLATLHHTLLGTGRQTDRQPLFWPPCATPYWGQADRQTDAPRFWPPCTTPYWGQANKQDGSSRQADRQVCQESKEDCNRPLADRRPQVIMQNGRQTGRSAKRWTKNKVKDLQMGRITMNDRQKIETLF
jgi:hypothetical protein